MEGEREGEKHESVASHTPPTRDLAHNPGICPDQESNLPPSGSQASAQSTEPHQPELELLTLLSKLVYRFNIIPIKITADFFV